MRAGSNVMVEEFPRGLIALILVSAASAIAQSAPASISTIPQPSGARPFFDASGNTYYLSGQPTAGAAQTQPGGGTCSIPGFGGVPIPAPCRDASVMKVDPSGNQTWGTLLGGPTADNGTALAIDTNGNVVLTGSTDGQFPTTPGTAIGSSTSAKVFAAKITADGSKFLYSTYLPESLAASSVIAVDAAGNAYIAGKTSAGHAFVLKLSADGSTIVYNATLAGSSADAVTAIAVDSAGNAFVAGQTTSPDFPVTAGAFQQQLKGTRNNFLVRLDPSGNVLSSTYFGGSGSDNPSGIAMDGAGNIDLVGSTSSLDLPTTPGTMQPSAIVPAWNNSSPAGFVAQFALADLNSNGALLDATYLGNRAGGDIIFVGALLPLPGGTVLIGWRETPNGVVSKVQFGSAGLTAPACLSNDVLNSATLSGSGGIAPGELVTLTGFGIGPDIGVVYQPDAQGNVPTQLVGVQVLFDGVPVPILYAQSRQINAIAPVGPAVNGTRQVTVTYNNQQFGPAVAEAILGNPGIFRLQFGQSAQAAAINQDGTLNGPTNPAARGSVVAVWGTGYGQTNPPCQSGGLNLPDAEPLSPGISAVISSVDPGVQEPAVQYAGSAPTVVCGVVQINFQVPVNVAPGAYSFSPRIVGNGTIQPQIGATIAVK